MRGTVVMEIAQLSDVKMGSFVMFRPTVAIVAAMARKMAMKREQTAAVLRAVAAKAGRAASRIAIAYRCNARPAAASAMRAAVSRLKPVIW